ncbi:hypothetical protein T479_09005 [Lysinibacillus varians]|nr:hypothetical protein T479_09005 [Lysinibacillus varians]
MNVPSFTLCVETNYCSEKHDTPAGTARVENPFLWRPPQKLVGAVLAKRERMERKSTFFILFKKAATCK